MAAAIAAAAAAAAFSPLIDAPSEIENIKFGILKFHLKTIQYKYICLFKVFVMTYFTFYLNWDWSEIMVECRMTDSIIN